MMTRLYDPQTLAIGSTIYLSDHANHHLLAVLRAKVGDKIILFNGTGGEYSATVKVLTKKQIQATITAFTDKNIESPLQIHLAQSMPRGDKMDFIVQKAVELGVFSIMPIIAERTQGRLTKEQEQKKIARLAQIVIAACEQCGRNYIPSVQHPVTLSQWLSQTKNEKHRYILTPHQPSGASLSSLATHPKSVYILIGPEGGFTDDETTVALQQGLIPFTLGKRILRTETASIAALSIMQWYAGDFH